MIQLDLPHMPKTPDTIEITDLDQFIGLLSRWHAHKLNVLKHMLEVPETAEVSIGDEPPVTVAGDFRKGYQLGISLALSELGELPFLAELGESAAVELKH